MIMEYFIISSDHDDLPTAILAAIPDWVTHVTIDNYDNIVAYDNDPKIRHKGHGFIESTAPNLRVIKGSTPPKFYGKEPIGTCFTTGRLAGRLKCGSTYTKDRQLSSTKVGPQSPICAVLTIIGIVYLVYIFLLK